MDSTPAIHRAAADGYAKGADTYVRGRPDYPPEIDAWLHETLGLTAGSTVLDLGAGTGKFTPRLLATGARVIAVEPVAAMLAKLAATQPGVRTMVGKAEAIPLPDASVDVVVCAQAFHWFATAEALTEIHRVLKPGGRLALVWNMRDARVPWVARMDSIVNEFEGDAPRYYTGAWRKAFPHPGFGAMDERHYANHHTGSPEDVILNRVRSTSFISALPPQKQALVDERLRALIAAEPELRDQAVVTVPYDTAAYCLARLD
ncbi:MAG: class I SAM-dependent methyltransferase [Pigmentiphaga sp.]|uniref:class I SAM-dependent methyltransferase n=1 Tax=Pigmentiphaga sp. TaxID=1977564 RepID=UPI0029B9D3E6|nr:class I SAM-dependent methyltransferase [Pigmentiphaga sp.]MDX3906125.1 class I SAM-dependent methyltransferase [Pigmentiphaga sp.]